MLTSLSTHDIKEKDIPQENPIFEIQLLGMPTSRYVTGVSILTSVIESIYQRLPILQNNLFNAAKSWSVKYRIVYKVWPT